MWRESLSGYVDGIMARVFAHEHVVELAHWATVPVINGLSDYNHPTQVLADLFTIQEEMGALQGVTLAYVGDGNNVVTSLLYGAALTGMHLRIASPPGYSPSPTAVEGASSLAHQTGASIELMTDPVRAVSDADIIYTDVWTSMGQESEYQERLRIFLPTYQVNEQLLHVSGNPDVKVMHCLPAHRGEEITDGVADSPQSLLWVQAENRLHAQKALLARLLGWKNS